MLDTKALAGATATILREALAPIVARLEAIEKRQPEKGDAGKDADMTVVRQMIDEAFAALPVPKDGKDADPEAVAAVVATAVASAISELPPAAADEALLEPLVEAAVAKAVAALPVPKDGVGLAGAIIDREGRLAITLTDGAIRELGPVVGKDADHVAIAERIDARFKALPVPKDGVDGLGFDDLTVEHDGERGFTFNFVRGEQSKSFTFSLPVVIDRGVYQAERGYEPGDAVTWAGSLWVAKAATTAKPDTGPDWRLAVKRGRDGKDATTK